MSGNTYSISEIREEITRLPERFDREPEAVTITHYGKPVMAILPWELYESLIETLEVMSDPDLMAAFRQGVQEQAVGRREKGPGIVIEWQIIMLPAGSHTHREGGSNDTQASISLVRSADNAGAAAHAARLRHCGQQRRCERGSIHAHWRE